MDFDYWRIFTDHSKVVKGNSFHITMTRNAGDAIDLKSGGTLSSVTFLYKLGGRTIAAGLTSLTWGNVGFDHSSSRRQLSAADGSDCTGAVSNDSV